MLRRKLYYLALYLKPKITSMQLSPNRRPNPSFC